MDVRAARADLAARLDEVDAVVVVLLDPRRDREDIGIEDDVLGRKADADQQLVGALADLDLALLGIGLADLVERHDDDRRAISHALAGMSRNAASPSFMLIELTIGLPETHFSPASITDHFELSIITGTRAISGSAAISLRKVVIA